MALCKDLTKVSASNSTAFDKPVRQGTLVLYEGIYRCMGCGIEIAAVGGKPMPRERERPHKPGCTEQNWKLLVSANG
jgi:hypothetical protein